MTNNNTIKRYIETNGITVDEFCETLKKNTIRVLKKYDEFLEQGIADEEQIIEVKNFYSKLSSVVKDDLSQKESCLTFEKIKNSFSENAVLFLEKTVGHSREIKNLPLNDEDYRINGEIAKLSYSCANSMPKNERFADLIKKYKNVSDSYARRSLP